MPQNSELRIASGHYRGRTLASPTTAATHPMGAREKLALFNMVNVEQAVVLDAYAGSGALGIEALSRGARKVVFVDKSPKSCRTIRQNLTTIIGEHDFPVYVETLANFAEHAEFVDYFDIILADPPYDNFQIVELQNLPKLLKNGGVLALSSPAAQDPPTMSGLRLSSTHTYARARISVYCRDT